MKRSRLSLLLALIALTSAAQAADQVPLKLELPKPLFAGTPRPIQLSDPLPVIGELTFLTDGDKSGTDGTYVELGPTPQWVQIDLGASAKVAAIAVWHFHSQARVYHDVVVQVSNDKDFKTGVTTVYNNDDDNSSKLGKGKDLAYIENFEGRLFEAKGAVGRYVRLYSNGNTSDELNHYCEVEVHGAVAK